MNDAECHSGKVSAGRLLLEALRNQQVEWLFGNAGTDFAAIIEAYATHPDPAALPRPVTVPHENLAVAMAHGAYLLSGRPPAVMVHVNVGTANAICGLINAARERIPLILCAGRNPITEEGTLASRNAFIHWGQEMFDQGAMVRELVKWDYELRRAEQTVAVVNRAATIAMSEPRGPVYLTLPRETLSEEAAAPETPPRPVPLPAPVANPIAIAEAAELLSVARRPLVVTASFGRTTNERQALAQFCARHQVAVAAERPRIMPIASNHPAFIGFEPARHLSEADLIIALCCDVPWIPRNACPDRNARIVHVGHDPLYSRYPVRTHRADLVLDGDPAESLRQLAERASSTGDVFAERSEWLTGRREEFERLCEREIPTDGPANYEAVAVALSRQIRSGDIIVCETAFPTELLHLPDGVSLLSAPSAGGLGWGLGAALGAKLAAPRRRVIALVGDGAYMFGNPTPAHYVAAAQELPFLTIILNNSMWAAVRRATLAVYPESVTRKMRKPVFTSLEPSPAFHQVVEASGGFGEAVRTARELAPALERALNGLDAPGRQAVLNVVIS